MHLGDHWWLMRVCIDLFQESFSRNMWCWCWMTFKVQMFKSKCIFDTARVTLQLARIKKWMLPCCSRVWWHNRLYTDFELNFYFRVSEETNNNMPYARLVKGNTRFTFCQKQRAGTTSLIAFCDILHSHDPRSNFAPNYRVFAKIWYYRTLLVSTSTPQQSLQFDLTVTKQTCTRSQDVIHPKMRSITTI